MCRPAEGRPTSTSPTPIVRAVEHRRAVDDPDDEPGDVVLARRVEARHLGRLAAEQRAAVLAAASRDPRDDRLEHVGLERAGRDVVEEEQRARALHEDVVDAVVDEVAPDRVV